MRLENADSYPRTYAVLKDIRSLCLNNSRVWRSFQLHSKATRNEVSQILSLGTRPDIVLVTNLTSERGNTSYGIFNGTFGSQTIRIRKNVILGLEQAKLEETIFGTGFFLAITILHELVHYFRYHKKLKNDVWEYGLGFERDAIGFTIELDNIGSKYLEFKNNFDHLRSELRKTKKHA